MPCRGRQVTEEQDRGENSTFVKQPQYNRHHPVPWNRSLCHTPMEWNLMAKKKTKSQTNALGLKLPKSLRNAAWLDDLLQSEIGRKILADALVAAAGAAAAALTRYGAQSEQFAKVKKAAVETGSEATSAAKDLVGTAVSTGVKVVSAVAEGLLPTTESDGNDQVQTRRVRKSRQTKDTTRSES